MSPGRLTAMPSAMVGSACTGTGCPAAAATKLFTT